MSTTPKPPAAGTASTDNPADIAREAFRRLATRRIAPTPQNYQIIYNEVAGIVEPEPEPAESPAEAMLATFAGKLTDTPGELHDFGRRFSRAAKNGDWETYGRNLNLLVEKHFRKSTPAIELVDSGEGPVTRQLREMLARTLSFAVASLLDGSPDLVAEAESLGAAVKTAYSD